LTPEISAPTAGVTGVIVSGMVVSFFGVPDDYFPKWALCGKLVLATA
jgi:hypothetical protein